MKIATVKPIPAVLPVAARSDLLAPFGNSAMFNFAAAIVVAKIPIGFPATNPKKIPQAITDWVAWLKVSELTTTPVLAKAKIGTQKNALYG